MVQRRTRQSVIEQVADFVQAAYADERSHWHALHGRQVGELRGKVELWQRMAAFMLDNRIDNYRAFLHLQFELLGRGACCPPPRQCFGPAALRRWKEDLNGSAQAEEDMAYELEFQKGRLLSELAEAAGMASEMEWTADDVDCSVLLDDDNELSPLFRYCAAMKSLRPEIAKFYVEDAMTEYLLGKERYDKVWGDLITTELREVASQMVLGKLLD